MKELGAEVGGGLIIHHALIIRTLRYWDCITEETYHIHYPNTLCVKIEGLS